MRNGAYVVSVLCVSHGSKRVRMEYNIRAKDRQMHLRAWALCTQLET